MKSGVRVGVEFLLPLYHATKPSVTERQKGRESTLHSSDNLLLSFGRERTVEVRINGILREELEDHETNLRGVVSGRGRREDRP